MSCESSDHFAPPEAAGREAFGQHSDFIRKGENLPASVDVLRAIAIELLGYSNVDRRSNCVQS